MASVWIVVSVVATGVMVVPSKPVVLALIDCTKPLITPASPEGSIVWLPEIAGTLPA